MIDSGRGAAGAENAHGAPAQSHISPSILVYEEFFVQVLGRKIIVLGRGKYLFPAPRVPALTAQVAWKRWWGSARVQGSGRGRETERELEGERDREIERDRGIERQRNRER